MEKIVVSAPGKVILHGEHSVVYGRRAIALSVDLRTTLTLSPTINTVEIRSHNLDFDLSWPLHVINQLYNELDCYKNSNDADISSIPSSADEKLHQFLGIPKDEVETTSLGLKSFFHLYFSILPKPLPLAISVVSKLPTGAGLGSSAAYAVCLSAALLKLVKCNDIDIIAEQPSRKIMAQSIYDTICKWAYSSEQIVHGSPSGIDNSICTFGGGVSFKNKDITPIEVPPIGVLLVNTRVKRNTKVLVFGVQELYDKYPNIVEPILNSIDEISEKSLSVLQSLIDISFDNSSSLRSGKANKLYEELYDMVDINHAQLNALGVSHSSLEKIVAVAKSHKLHAKLTGAGGGGFAFILLGKDTSREAVINCRNELEESGFEVFNTKLGTAGVTLHL